ncbi:GAF domain-containing protein [Desulfosarcina cetonica]|uniref:GAF domain-containing protein n=1 Tax=Desulfosarcina cetonica TaxID=90730 RepID=UPI0030EDC587
MAGTGNEAPCPSQCAHRGDFTHHPATQKRQAISVNQLNALSPIEQAPYNGFCASGTQSTLVAPLFYGRSLLGILGADAVRQPVAWSREHQRLLLLVGSAIVNALLRRQIENAPGTVRSRLFPLFDSSPATDTDSALVYDGPIEIVDDDDMAMAPGIEWRFETDTGSHADPATLLRLTDGRFIHLACPTCHRHQQLDISEIRHLGSALKVTCACDTVMHVKIELRRELRRSVNLDGIIVRKKTDWKGLTFDDWNKIHIVNLSRHGIGFKLLGSLELGVDDRFEIKFNLNNRAESLIQKTAVVRSIHDAIVGCQFAGEHPCDANIAFYVLT